MEIILLKDINKVGDKHEVITVKNGFGRNYLIPQGFAIIANDKNRGRLDELKKGEQAEQAKMVDQYKAIAEKLNGKVIKIGAKAGTSGKIFGSVTNIQLAAALKDQFGVEIERKRIDITEEVKTLGAYKATLNLHAEVATEIDFEVVGE